MISEESRMQVEQDYRRFGKSRDKARRYLGHRKFQDIGATPVTPEMLASAEEKTYHDSGVDVPIDMSLAQAQLESRFGTLGRRAIQHRNPYNWGEFDDGTTLREFPTWQEGVQAYYNQMARNYLRSKLRDFQGSVYATRPGYEQDLENQIRVVNSQS